MNLTKEKIQGIIEFLKDTLRKFQSMYSEIIARERELMLSVEPVQAKQLAVDENLTVISLEIMRPISPDDAVAYWAESQGFQVSRFQDLPGGYRVTASELREFKQVHDLPCRSTSWIDSEGVWHLTGNIVLQSHDSDEVADQVKVKIIRKVRDDLETSASFTSTGSVRVGKGTFIIFKTPKEKQAA